MIVLDNSILSRIVRWRRAHVPTKELVADLAAQGRLLVVPGIVVQEVLSGVPEGPQLDAVELRLLGFTTRLATLDHHRCAAHLRTQCQAQGIAISTPDALIAAFALVEEGIIMTADEDFLHMAKVTPQLKLIWVN